MREDKAALVRREQEEEDMLNDWAELGKWLRRLSLHLRKDHGIQVLPRATYTHRPGKRYLRKAVPGCHECDGYKEAIKLMLRINELLAESLKASQEFFDEANDKAEH